MSLSLGELLLSLRIDPTVYYQQLEKARQAAVKSGQNIEKSLLLQAKVDDKSLTDLNKHLDVKQQHWIETRRLFERQPIKPKVDDQELTKLNKTLDQLGKRKVSPFVGGGNNANSGASNNVVAAPRVDTGELEKTLTKAVTNSFKTGFKSVKSGGLMGLITAPFKMLGSAGMTILEGVGLQIGQSIAKDLGEGLADGINAELSYLIGSFGLVGRELGQGLAEELLDAFGADLQGFEQFVEDLIGKQKIDVEGFNVRGRQASARETDRGFAGEQARREQQSYVKNAASIKQQNQQLREQGDKIRQLNEAYYQEFVKRFKQSGGDKLRENVDRARQSREQAFSQMSEASSFAMSEGTADEAIARAEAESAKIAAARQQEANARAKISQTTDKAELKAATASLDQALESQRLAAQAEALYRDIAKQRQAVAAEAAAVSKQYAATTPEEEKSANQEKAAATQAREAADHRVEQRLSMQRDQVKALDMRYQDASRQFDDLHQQVDGSLNEQFIELQRQIDDYYRNQRQIGKQVKVVDNQSLLRVPPRVAARTGQFVQEAAGIKTNRVEQIEGFYQAVVREVAQRSNLPMPSAGMIPKLVANDQLKAGSMGSYRPKQNEIHVRPEMFQQIVSGEMSDEDFETLVHELRHAMQLLFGQLTGSLEVGVDLLKATAEEASRLGGRVEGSTAANKGKGKAYNRAIEEDAYVFADRNKTAIRQAVDARTAKGQFVETAGIGGGRLSNLLKTQAIELINTAREKAALLSEKTGMDFQKEFEQFFQQIEQIDDAFNVELQNLGDLDDLSPEQIKQRLQETIDVFNRSVNDLKTATVDFMKEAVSKPQRLVDEARAAMGTMNRKKDLVPIAQKVGIANADQLGKSDLIEAIAAQPNKQQMADAVFEVSRARATKIRQRREAIDAAKAQAADAAYGAGVVARRAVEKGQQIAASPQGQMVGQAARKAIGAAGAVAQTGYRALEGAEAVALDLMPAGRMIKAAGKPLIKNVAMPALLAAGATHAPVVGHAAGAMLDLGSNAASAMMSPLVHMAENAASVKAVEVVDKLLPHIDMPGGIAGSLPGVKEVVDTINLAHDKALTVINEAIEFGANFIRNGVAEGAATIAGGKAIQKAALKPVENLAPLALPHKTRQALPESEPEKQLEPVPVEVVQKPHKKQMAAEIAPVAPKPNNPPPAPTESAKPIPYLKPKPTAAPKPSTEFTAVAQEVSKYANITAAQGVQRAKEIAAKIREGYQGLKNAVQKGDRELANAMVKTIDVLAVTASEEIGQLTDALGDEAKMGSKAGNQINNAKSQVSRARNLANQARAKFNFDDDELNSVEDLSQQVREYIEKFRQSLKASIPEVAAIAGGTIAGVAGGQAGPVASGAAGVVGSVAARQAAVAGQSASNAYARLKESEQFKSGTLLQKFNAVLAETTVNMRAMEAEFADGITGDLSGAAIAAAIDQVLDAISPTLAAIPGKGAAVAAVAAPAVVKARRQFAEVDMELNAAEDLGAVLDDVMRSFDGTENSAEQVMHAFLGLDEVIEQLRDRMGMTPEGSERRQMEQEAELYRQQFAADAQANNAQRGFNNAEFRFAKAERSINDRAQPVAIPDINDAHETIASRIKRIFDANGGFDGIGGGISGLIGKLTRLPAIVKMAITSFLGFNAIGFIAPLFAKLTDGAAEAALEMERLERVINFTSGSSQKGAENIAVLSQNADRLGLDLRSSISGYAQFSASTKETPLEGDQSMRIFQGVSQASANYALNPQAQERVFLALSQMASKGVVSMEELRQQLGESLPGALNVAARSMGMTTKEFSKMVERGEVLASDFLPKFAQQLSAESASGAAGAANSAQASFNRLNNSIFKLQATIGKGVLFAQKLGADAAVLGLDKLIHVLEFLIKILPAVGTVFTGKFIGSLAAGKAVIPFILAKLAALGPMLLKLLPTIAAFAVKFMIFQTITDVIGMFWKATRDQGGSFRDGAKQMTESIKQYDLALQNARKTQDGFKATMPKADRDLKGESLAEGTMVGGIAKLIAGDAGTDFVRWAESGIQKRLGLRTFAQKQADDRTMAMNDLIGQRGQMRLNVAQQTSGPHSELSRMREIDKRLESIQAKRRALATTNPQDTEGQRALKRQEEELLKQRETLSKPIGALQQANAQEIETYKDAIKNLNQLASEGKITQSEYNEKLQAFQAALDGAEKDQEKLNKALKTSVNSLEMFERAWSKIADRLADTNLAIQRTNDLTRKTIAETELAGGTEGSSNRAAEILQQEQLQQKIQATRNAIQQMRAELAVQDIETVKLNFGITDETGANELKTLADRATGPKEKALLGRLSELKQLEGEVVGFEADLAEAQVAAKRRLRDLSKQVQEFYRGIERQAQEAALDAKSIQREIAGNNAKAKLRSALKGFQDNYISEFVDSLISLVDSLNEPFKMAIEANKQIMQRQNQLSDTMRQAQELGNQLPTGYEGMGLSGAQMQQAAQGVYGTNPSNLNNTIRVVRTGKKDEFGGEELQVQLIKGGKVVATEKAASGSIRNQTFEVAGRNTQKARSYAPIPEGMYKLGMPEYTRGSFGEGLGSTWVDILDPRTGSSAISGTGRSAFGLHEDSNRWTGKPGSAGCVVFYDAAATKRVADWVKGGARKLQVDWGLGTFSSGIKAPAANQTLPSPRSLAQGIGGNLEQKIAAGLQIAIPEVKKSEAFRSKPYDDGVGVRTIGYGETRRDIVNRGYISEPEAAKLMEKRLERDYLRPALNMIPKAVREKLTPGQIAAIGSFAYNTGVGKTGFPKSSFGRALIQGDLQRAEQVLPTSYINRGTAVEQGLRNRRQEELKMWRSSGPAPGMMMPTTGMSQGQIERYEFDAKQFQGLRGQVDQATALAQQTTNAEVQNIKRLVESQITLKQAENLQQIRKAQRQLVVGGREQSRGNRGVVEGLEDVERSLGDDTALKSLRNDIAAKRREARDYKERLSDAIEKTQSSLVDAESLIRLIESGQMPEQFNQFLPELKKQRDSIQGQLKKLKDADAKVDQTFGKAVADIQRKYNLDLYARQFESGQALSAAQIKSARAEAEQIRTRIELPFTAPDDKKVGQLRAAKLDRYAGLSEAQNETAQRKEELRKLQISQPDVYTPERVAQEVKLLDEALKRRNSAIESQYQKTIKDIDHDLVVKELERARESMRRDIEQMREQARDLQVQAKDEQLLRSDPIKALDLQQQALQKNFQADSQDVQLQIEEFNQQQDELVRSSQRTKRAAEEAKTQFEALNQVKLANLKSELEQNTAELQRQRQEIEYQSQARVFESAQQFGGLQVQKLREFDGKGIGAIDLQQKLDLERLDFDLKAKLRDIDLDKSLLPEAKQKLREDLQKSFDLQSTDITIKADLAREENDFQAKTLQFQSAMQINNARGNYARTFGFESQARDFEQQAAIAQENYNLADGLRKIDEQARQLGLAPEVVERLKGELESLNQINLQNINAQFSPLVEGLKGVKGAFQGFMGDIISGNESIGDAFDKMVSNILNSLSSLAAQLITEQLFGSIFGLGKGAGGGGIGGIFGSIFGFSEGGDVPALDHSDLRQRPDAVGQALRKEGPNSVLAALTPGERVLSVPERMRFDALGLGKLVAPNANAAMGMAMRSERMGRIYNFSAGGVVPGGPVVQPGAAQNLSNTNINIPIDIKGEGGEGAGGINAQRLRDMIRSVVIQELRQQKRPRGELF